MHEPPDLDGFERAVGPAGRVRGQGFEVGSNLGLILRNRPGGLTPRTGDVCTDLVAADRGEPGEEGGLAPPGVKLAARDDEGVLCDVLRGLGRANPNKHKTTEPGKVGVEELGKGGLVACEHPSNELALGAVIGGWARKPHYLRRGRPNGKSFA